MTPEQQLRGAHYRLDDEASVRKHNPPEGFDPQLSRLFVDDITTTMAAVGRLLEPIPDGRFVRYDKWGNPYFDGEAYRAWLIGGEKPQ